jgi:hypothetical protein
MALFFFTEMNIYNLPPEVLPFSNQTFIHENLFFYFTPGLIVIGPLNFSIIYKTVLGFKFNQFSS